MAATTVTIKSPTRKRVKKEWSKKETAVKKKAALNKAPNYTPGLPLGFLPRYNHRGCQSLVTILNRLILL